MHKQTNRLMDKPTEKENSSKKSPVNILTKVVLPLVLGVLILYFLFRDTDFGELWGAIKDANYGILAFSLIFGLLGNTLRGYRWEILLKPLGYRPRLSTLNYAIYGGYAVNFAIPRGGEVWRCAIVAKEEKIPVKKLVGTIIVDRIFDMITVITLCFIAFLLNMNFFIKEIKSRLDSNQEALDSFTSLVQSPWLYIAIVAAIALTYVIFKFFGDNFIVKKISGFFIELWKDLKDIGRMRQKYLLIAYSIGIWACYFLYFYITFYAFEFTADLGITVGLIAFAISSLSMGVPTNGGMGAWHFAVIAALTLYGVSEIEAKAFATGVFAIQSIWLIFCGLVGMAMLSLRKKSKETTNS